MRAELNLQAERAAARALAVTSGARTGRVHSVFRRCCNVTVGSAEWLTIGAEPFPLVPDGIIVCWPRADFAAAGLAAGDAVEISRTRIGVPAARMTIRLAGCETYETRRKALVAQHSAAARRRCEVAWTVIERAGSSEGLGQARTQIRRLARIFHTLERRRTITNRGHFQKCGLEQNRPILGPQSFLGRNSLAKEQARMLCLLPNRSGRFCHSPEIPLGEHRMHPVLRAECEISGLGGAQEGARAGGLSALGRRAVPAIAALCRGVVENQPAVMSRHVRRLLGLGVGLTPSGDDVLAGLAAGLLLGGVPQSESGFFPALRQAIDRGGATTVPSERALRAIVEGEIAEDLYAVAEAILAGTDGEVVRTVTALLALGSSSGTETAMGVCLGLQMAEARQRRGRAKGE